MTNEEKFREAFGIVPKIIMKDMCKCTAECIAECGGVIYGDRPFSEEHW